MKLFEGEHIKGLAMLNKIRCFIKGHSFIDFHPGLQMLTADGIAYTCKCKYCAAKYYIYFDWGVEPNTFTDKKFINNYVNKFGREI